MITRNIEVVVKPTPFELASEWCDMDANQQAQFFAHIYELAEDWVAPLPFQLQAITDCRSFDARCSAVMRTIGEYAEKISPTSPDKT